MFSLIWGIIALLGGYHVLATFQWPNLLWLVLFFFGYAIQSMFEELLCRGYIMGYWLKQHRRAGGFVERHLFHAFASCQSRL